MVVKGGEIKLTSQAHGAYRQASNVRLHPSRRHIHNDYTHITIASEPASPYNVHSLYGGSQAAPPMVDLSTSSNPLTFLISHVAFPHEHLHD